MAGLRSVPVGIAWSPWQIFSRLTSQFSLYRFGGIAYGKEKGNKKCMYFSISQSPGMLHG